MGEPVVLVRVRENGLGRDAARASPVITLTNHEVHDIHIYDSQYLRGE